MRLDVMLRIMHSLRAVHRGVQRRFLAKVDRQGPDECWPWKAGTNGQARRPAGNRRLPYGKLKVNGSLVLAHRWALFGVAALRRAEMALHTCDNTLCCNPRHLYAGTNRDNMLDARDRRRLCAYRVRGRFARKEAA